MQRLRLSLLKFLPLVMLTNPFCGQLAAEDLQPIRLGPATIKPEGFIEVIGEWRSATTPILWDPVWANSTRPQQLANAGFS